MQRLKTFLLFATLCVCTTASAQKYVPKSIQFKGAPDYRDQELMNAIGLKNGESLSSTEMNAYSQKLMDSGLFSGLTFKFDGQDLVFRLTPAQLYPIRLENLPFGTGPELDSRLHARVPLYHGKVPGTGGLLNDVHAALQEELRAQRIDASLAVAPYSDPVQHKAVAISFTITSPAVVLGHIVSDTPLTPEAQDVVARMEGKPYDREGSALALKKYLADRYQDMGYLEASIDTAQQNNLVVEANVVRIPFTVSVKPGALYHITSIQLAPDMIVKQADFDKQANIRSGDVADAKHIEENWHYIERQYHNLGYVKAHITATPTLNQAGGTVQYAVSAESGPVYTMGKLTIQNVSTDLQSLIQSAWKMQPGAVFNEGAILGMFATHGVNPQLERLGALVKVKYTLNLNEPEKTVDVVLRLEKKS